MNAMAWMVVAQAKSQGPDLIQTIGFMAIIFALFYFMMIRPQTKREKERRKMIDAIKTGDHTLFVGEVLEAKIQHPDSQPLVFRKEDFF